MTRCIAVLVALGAMASTALAEPVILTDVAMDRVTTRDTGTALVDSCVRLLGGTCEVGDVQAGRGVLLEKLAWERLCTQLPQGAACELVDDARARRRGPPDALALQDDNAAVGRAASVQSVATVDRPASQDDNAAVGRAASVQSVATVDRPASRAAAAGPARSPTRLAAASAETVVSHRQTGAGREAASVRASVSAVRASVSAVRASASVGGRAAPRPVGAPESAARTASTGTAAAAEIRTAVVSSVAAAFAAAGLPDRVFSGDPAGAFMRMPDVTAPTFKGPR